MIRLEFTGFKETQIRTERTAMRQFSSFSVTFYADSLKFGAKSGKLCVNPAFPHPRINSEFGCNFQKFQLKTLQYLSPSVKNSKSTRFLVNFTIEIIGNEAGPIPK